MIYNIRLDLSYEGTHYHGWQSSNEVETIEGKLTKALQILLKEAPRLQAASRTDAGVHAHGQVVNFFVESPSPIDLGKLRHSLNSLLPRDISVKGLSLAPPAFHPTLDCSAKEYRYHLFTGKVMMPHRRFFTWHRPHIFNAQIVQETAQLLTGEHDFAAFVNSPKQCSYTNTVRTVDKIEVVQRSADEFYFVVTGKNFLYKMVRNIVGTLVYISEGRLSASELSLILKSKQRVAAGMTAPACGLTLYKVNYFNPCP